MTPEAPGPSEHDDVHEWISFEHRGETWLFDVTFLTSNWLCIWDDGCLGIGPEPAPEKGEGCCSLGAHFTDEGDYLRVLGAAGSLDETQWQHRRSLEESFSRDDDGVWTTAVVDGACVFLNRPGFAGGHGCALHRGAIEARGAIVDWKPEVCWQLPVRVEYHEDENGHSVATVREWRRHDWGDGGQDFHWWCTEGPEAFVAHTPLYSRIRPELNALIGDELTDRLITHLTDRGEDRLLAHPALRVAHEDTRR